MDSKDSSIFFERDLMLLSFEAFNDMREKSELIDFKITFQNRSFTGHRVVLAATIPHFRKIFTSSEEELTFNEIDPDVLESVINFAYSGRIEITFQNVRSLLTASKFMQLTRVYNACLGFLEDRLHPDNVLEIRTLAENHRCLELVGIADDYIRQNFEEFSNSVSFLSFPFPSLKKVLRRDDVRVSTEEKVFEAVMRWIKFSPSKRKELLPELLGVVRMYHLTPNYLIGRISTEELVRSSITCRDLVDEVKSYHLLPDMRSMKSEFNRLVCRPRLYEGQLQHVTSAGNADGHSVYALCDTKSGFSVKLLDSENETWLNLSTCEGMHFDKVVALTGVIYIFCCEAVVTFDVSTRKLNTYKTAYESVYSSGIVVHDNRIYLVGGCVTGLVLYFDPSQNKWHEQDKMKRYIDFPGVASLTEYIYITGGKSGDEALNSVERYNPKTKEWGEISPMLSKRYDHGCASLNGKIYVCGGFNGRRLKSAEVCNPLTDQWNFISSMKESRRSSSSFLSNKGGLYVLEKLPDSSQNTVTVEIYDPEHDEWKFGVPLPINDQGRLLFLVNVRIY